ncbi:MAG: PEGA domain-containing protein [Spirochaetales bacterium]|nr:PEGA domain-containing protein [Spirochaetales bacterium]
MKKINVIISLSVLLLFVAGAALFAQPKLKVATVQFTSNVRGAQVYLNGKLMGRTPVVQKLPINDYQVRVTAPGYEDYNETVRILHDMTVNAELRRRQREFTLSIQANVPQAIVTINGEDQNGFAPMNVRLPQGRYEVKVSKRGYGTFETSVTLNRDQRITARLSAPDARIIIVGPQRHGRGGLRFEVSIDGRRVNGTEFRVNPGRHTIQVDAGGLLAEREVNCRPGRTYRFKLDLDLQAPQEADD